MILNTCFLIQLQKEFRSGQGGPAMAFLKSHQEIHLYISVITVTEFLEGFADIETGERLLRCYDRLEVDSRVAKQAAIIRRQLRESGQLIGDLDILIGATAIVENLPLVTNNVDHFNRIPGLNIVSFQEFMNRG